MTCPKATQLGPVSTSPRIRVFKVQMECALSPVLPANALFSLLPAGRGLRGTGQKQCGQWGDHRRENNNEGSRGLAVAGTPSPECCPRLVHFYLHGNLTRRDTEALRSQVTCQGPHKLSMERRGWNPGGKGARMKAPSPPGGPLPLGLTPGCVSLFAQCPIWPSKQYCSK